jgi:hypothetical protein
MEPTLYFCGYSQCMRARMFESQLALHHPGRDHILERGPSYIGYCTFSQYISWFYYIPLVFGLPLHSFLLK